jgi:hypothetical protein
LFSPPSPFLLSPFLHRLFQILCNSGHLTFVPLRDLPNTLEHLSLTKNNLTYLPTDAFSGLRNLRKLTLDANSISSVESFAFRGLNRLRELSIQHTPLSSLKKFSFSGLQNVTAILLGYNQISVIDEYAFTGTSNIRLILLNNNPLHTVRTRCFTWSWPHLKSTNKNRFLVNSDLKLCNHRSPKFLNCEN